MDTISLNSEAIESESVFDFVSSRLDFILTIDQWKVIDIAMGEY
jgi:hypothetical protein